MRGDVAARVVVKVAEVRDGEGEGAGDLLGVGEDGVDGVVGHCVAGWGGGVDAWVIEIGLLVRVGLGERVRAWRVV